MHRFCKSRSPLTVTMIAALAIVVFMAVVPTIADASHFRGGTITWVRTTGNTVEFRVLSAWRTTATTPNSAKINFGDGNLGPTVTIGTNAVVVGTGTDLAGEQFTIVEHTTTHTYATAGPFTAFYNNCCRIASLINSGSTSYRVEACVDLRNGNNGSAVTTLPIILQMPVNQIVNVAVPVADPDGDATTCRMATTAESSITAVATAGGFPLTINAASVLNWNTAGTAVGQKYAAQIVVESTHLGNVCKTSYDFIIEIVGGTANRPPTCAGTVSGLQNLVAGVPFSAQFTGADPDGDNLTVTLQSVPVLPGAATLTPVSGTTQPEPFVAQFDWTPNAGDVGSAFAVTITFTDSLGLQALCSFSIQVSAPVPVFFHFLRATSHERSVDLEWASFGDEEVAGFNVYRREAASSAEIRVDPGMLDPLATRFVDHDVNAGAYEYVVAAVTRDGTEFRSAPTPVTVRAAVLGMTQNYPNPFNPTTTIEYTLGKDVQYRLNIYNVQGKLVKSLAAGFGKAGTYTALWDGTDSKGNRVATGTYFYSLKAGNNVLTRKLVLLK